VESLKHEIALLEMRSEQLRIHLHSIPSGHPEARRLRAVISAMRTKLRALQQFARNAGATGRSRPTLH
jgi:ribosomal protein S15P/S13E